MTDLIKSYTDAKFSTYPCSSKFNPHDIEEDSEEVYYAYEVGLAEADYIIKKFEALESKVDKLLSYFGITE